MKSLGVSPSRWQAGSTPLPIELSDKRVCPWVADRPPVRSQHGLETWDFEDLIIILTPVIAPIDEVSGENTDHFKCFGTNKRRETVGHG
jgi:hypothetical protein